MQRRYNYKFQEYSNSNLRNLSQISPMQSIKMKTLIKSQINPGLFALLNLSYRLLINKHIYTHFFLKNLVYKPYNYVLNTFSNYTIYFITKIFINASFTINTSLSK